MWSVLNRKKKIVNRSLRTFTVLPLFSVYVCDAEKEQARQSVCLDGASSIVYCSHPQCGDGRPSTR